MAEANISAEEPKKVVGDGMTRKQARAIRLRNMNKEEIMYLRRKRAVEMVWPIFRFLILFGLGFVVMYPLIYMVTCAFRLQKDMNDPTVMWIPRNLTLSVIKDTASVMQYGKTLVNTLKMNIGCAVLQVLTCAITGYGFARFKFKGRNILFGVVIMMILVPPQIILIPQYMFFRYFDIFGICNAITGHELVKLTDNFLCMYIPAITANGIRSGLFILIFRQFFKGLPKELEDAAYLDGCGPFRTFIQIMVPNSSSSFLTVFLFSIVWYWNDYYVSSSFFTDNRTIALMLKNLNTELNIKLFNSATVSPDVRQKIVWLEAGCLLSVLPILVLYICLQKYFTEGIERSGLVG